MKYNFYSGVFWWQMSVSIKMCLRIFAPALTVSDLLTFKMFDLEKVGQHQGVQLLQWHHSMANIKICINNFLHSLCSQETICTRESNTDRQIGTHRNVQGDGYSRHRSLFKTEILHRTIIRFRVVFQTSRLQQGATSWNLMEMNLAEWRDHHCELQLLSPCMATSVIFRITNLLTNQKQCLEGIVELGEDTT